MVDGGVDAIDRLGLGLMTSRGSETSATASDPPSPVVSTIPLETEAQRYEMQERNRMDRDRDEQAEAKGFKPPRPHIRQEERNAKPSIRDRLFGRRPEGASSPSKAEEGRVKPLSPIVTSPSNDDGLRRIFTQPAVSTPTRMDEDEHPTDLRPGHSRNLSLTRTMSNRQSTIRFAPESSVSSDTAPSMSNYGANAPGFKKNPNLAMFRTSSVKSTDGDAPSVSFAEPPRPR